MGTPGAITEVLALLRDGQRDEENRLYELVYTELKRIAARHIRRERNGQSLQSTGLVHEAYLRLVGQDISWQDRAHFYAVAAVMMRRILVDHARNQKAAKRRGGQRVELTDNLSFSQDRPIDLVTLDDALTQLAILDPRQSRIVEMRFFGGLTEEEIAHELGISSRTVKREWKSARAMLYGELNR